MGEGEQRRRRVRGARLSTRPAPPTPAKPAEPPVYTATTSDVLDQPSGEHQIIEHPVSAHDRDDRDERSLRGLIGGGSSQVSVRAALRARDASRPSDADIAYAVATLTIVHRGWAPRDS